MAYANTTKSRSTKGGSGYKPKKAWGKSKKTPVGTAIKHICGHTERHVLTGAKWKKDNDKKWKASCVCPTCWLTEQNAPLLASVEEYEMPDLEGTPKQVLWAVALRAKAIKKAQDSVKSLTLEVGNEILNVFLEAFSVLTKAKRWIEERDAELYVIAKLKKKQQDALDKLYASGEVPF